LTYLEQEIHAQPQVISELIDRECAHISEIAKAIRIYSPDFVLIAARGTSDNAARYAQYALGIHARLSVGLATPSIHTLYGTPPVMTGALVIGISQSGRAEDVLQVITDAKEQGALTVTITNDAASPLAQAADHHISLHAGPEQSVAATKTYTAQLTAVALLVASLVESEQLLAEIREVPALVEQTIRQSEPVKAWAEANAGLTSFATIGRGYNFCTAIETCLKVQELCSVIGQGYSEADFLHGPIAIVKPAFPVIVIAPAGKGSTALEGALAKLNNRRAATLVISNDARFESQTWVHLPAGMPEWLSPVSAIVPGQLLGLHLATAKGLPVDQPVGLTKVTITR